MNKWIISSGVLSLATMVLHVVGGGAEIHAPMLDSAMAPPVKAIWTVVWHFVTAVLGLNGAALIYCAVNKTARKPVIYLIAIQYLAMAILFFGYAIVRLGSPFELPHWTLFIGICVLALLGLKTSTSSTGSS